MLHFHSEGFLVPAPPQLEDYPLQAARGYLFSILQLPSICESHLHTPHPGGKDLINVEQITFNYEFYQNH